MQSKNNGGYPGPAEERALPAKLWVHLLFIVLLGVLAYSNSFHGAFVFDDEPSIAKNPVITNLANFFSGSAGYAYNPRRFVGYLTFALNYRLSGLNVTGFHIFNLAVHIINALLVYALVRLTLQTPFFEVQRSALNVQCSEPLIQNTKFKIQNFIPSLLTPHSSLIPFFAALLFVAHPIQTQAVAYIVQRLTSLATMFYLMSICLYGSGRLLQESGEAPKWKAVPLYLLSLISMLLAMKTKEIAFTLPVVVMLYEFTFFRVTLKKKLLVLAPVLLMILVIPLSLLNIDKPLGEILSDVSAVTQAKPTVSRWEYLTTQLCVVATYVRLLFWPANQNLDYDYPVYHSLFTPRVFLSLCFLLGLLALAGWLFFRSKFNVQSSISEIQNSKFKIHNLPSGASRLMAFGILWFFITLSVESSVIPITDLIFEHRVYLPSVGAFVALATAFVIISRRYFQGVGGRIPMLLALAVFIALAVATFNRNRVWRDNLTLWGDAVRKSPGKVRPYNNFGVALSDAGREAEAINVLMQAIRIKPDHPEAYYNLGRIYLTAGRYGEAVRMFSMALLLRPDYSDAYVNLAAAYIRVGRYADVVRLLVPAMAFLGERPDAHFNLCIAYYEMGDVGAVSRELGIVRSLDPAMAAGLEGFLGRMPPPGSSAGSSGGKGVQQ